MRVPEISLTFRVMTSLSAPIQVMIQQPGGTNYADFEIQVRYDLTVPYQVTLVFCEDNQWHFDLEMIRLASLGIGSGAGDILWEPSRTVRSCMRLRLQVGSHCGLVVFSIPDLARVWEVIRALRVANPDLCQDDEASIPVGVGAMLDDAILRMLEG